MSSNDFEYLSDDQWELIKYTMNWTPPLERGRKRTPFRKIWNAIFYILCKGCRWVDLPKNPEIYASRATAHRWLKRWQENGVFERIASQILLIAMKRNAIDLSRLSVDGSFSPGCWRR